MELLPRSLWLRCSCTLTIFFISFIYNAFAFITFEMRFRDQVEKLKSDDYYHQGLKKFQAESIGVITYLPDMNSLLIGAKNCFHTVDLTQPFADENAVVTVNWTAEDTNFQDCLIKGEEEWECQNFIQVMAFDYTRYRLVVCGTRAQDPRCRVYENYPNLAVSTEMDGKGKCQFDPTQQSTALFAGEDLYTATVGDYSGRDSVIYRSNVGDSGTVELRSRESDSKWFNYPIFIQSFEVEDWVLVFFREIAVEHVNGGDAIYARVGKVCKSDKGGEYILEEKWTTYQKARLNCSFPGAYPFYFDYLQDVWMVGEGDNRMFYGVFSTGGHEIPGSAVCMFNIQDIKEIFNEGQFKKQKSGNWYALPRDMEPNPRPGNCSLDSKTMGDESLKFISEYPLMDQSVPIHGDPYPIFDLTRADYRLTQIAVYEQKAKETEPYTILFLGTENGVVLKVALIPDGDKFTSNLLERIYVTPRNCQERIKELEIIESIVDGVRKDMLMVVTNSTVIELPLHRCSNYSSSCSCVQDPFCVWNNISEDCYEFSGNDFDAQDVRTIRDCEEIELPVPTPTAAECLCEPSPSVAPTEMHETTLMRTSSGPMKTPTPDAPTTTTPVVNSTTFKFTTTAPGLDKDKEASTELASGSGKEGNKLPTGPGPSGKDPDSNLIGPGSEASTDLKSQTAQLLLVFLIVGWALVLFCVPVIIFLFVSRRKGNYVPTATEESIFGSMGATRYPPSVISTEPMDKSKQKNNGSNGQTPHHLQNGNSTYLHLFPPVSPLESSTDPPLSSVRRSLSLTPSAATLERETPLGASRTQSLSRKKPPPVPPKRTNSVLSHTGSRCPPPNGYVRNPRPSNPTTPTKKRQCSSSSSHSSESSDREPPPYRPLSGSEDERRRRPSGASNTDLQTEYNHTWFQTSPSKQV